MKVLTLTLKKRYFDQIASGEKRVEYRDVKPHWKPRIEGRSYDQILFRHGYRPDSPTIRVEYHGWTFVEHEGKRSYALQLGRILEIRS